MFHLDDADDDLSVTDDEDEVTIAIANIVFRQRYNGGEFICFIL